MCLCGKKDKTTKTRRRHDGHEGGAAPQLDHDVPIDDDTWARVRAALDVVPAERLVVTPDCGMKYLPREVAQGKLVAMVAAARQLRQEVGAA